MISFRMSPRTSESHDGKLKIVYRSISHRPNCTHKPIRSAHEQSWWPTARGSTAFILQRCLHTKRTASVIALLAGEKEGETFRLLVNLPSLYTNARTTCLRILYWRVLCVVTAAMCWTIIRKVILIDHSTFLWIMLHTNQVVSVLPHFVLPEYAVLLLQLSPLVILPNFDQKWTSNRLESSMWNIRR